MLDIAVAYNKYMFLGHEFLTWLWFAMENDEEVFRQAEPDYQSLAIGNRIVLENRINEETTESLTIKGDDAGLEEGLLALKKGAVVAEMNLVFITGDHQWRFNIKGESLNLSSLKTPETGTVESRDDMEGAILEKLFLYQKVVGFMETVYGLFISRRLADDWHTGTVRRMQSWIQGTA